MSNVLKNIKPSIFYDEISNILSKSDINDVRFYSVSAFFGFYSIGAKYFEKVTKEFYDKGNYNKNFTAKVLLKIEDLVDVYGFSRFALYLENIKNIEVKCIESKDHIENAIPDFDFEQYVLYTEQGNNKGFYTEPQDPDPKPVLGMTINELTSFYTIINSRDWENRNKHFEEVWHSSASHCLPDNFAKSILALNKQLKEKIRATDKKTVDFFNVPSDLIDFFIDRLLYGLVKS